MNESKAPIEILKSGNPEEIINLLESLEISSLNDEAFEVLCALIEDEDKGIQNALSFFLLVNYDNRTSDFLLKYISSGNIGIRNLAGDILAKLGSKSTSALIRFLSISKDNDDLKFVIDLLGLICDPRSSEKIIEILSRSENENVIIACLEALGNLKSEESIDYLVMSYEKNDLFRPNVIEALGKIGSKQALDFLNQKYLIEDDFIKFSIIESLGYIGDEETFFFLLAELNQAEGPLVWPLIASIYHLKEKFGFDIPFDEKMKNAVVQTISAGDPYYKKVAGYLVTIFEDREINLACLKIYGEDAELDEIIKSKFHEYRKDKLLDITAIIDEQPDNLLSLLILLQEVLDNYQYNEITVTDLEYRNLIDSITKCLESADEEVRKNAMSLLFSIESNTALLFIDTMVQDDNIWNKLHLLDLICSLKYEKIKDALEILSKDENEMVSERAKSLIEENKQYAIDTEIK
ncbi:MAG: HEAT repeat domain-containing protein [Ignavibacteriaceae bacterium]